MSQINKLLNEKRIKKYPKKKKLENKERIGEKAT